MILFLIFVQLLCGSGPSTDSDMDSGSDSELFTIHGVWPEYTNNSYPQYCGYTNFNETQISDLVSELRVAWPSNSEPDMDFWKHEFDKHGSCVPNGTNASGTRSYFQTGLSLWHQLNTTEQFHRSGLSIGQSVQYSDMALWFQNATFHCTEGSPSVLSEIWYCFTVDVTPFACPDWLRGCPDIFTL